MNKFKYHFLGALVFMGTIVFTYIGYALWTDIPTQNSGDTMTADIWNNMVTSVNGMATTVNSLISTVNNISTKLSGTYTSGKMCTSDATGKIQCNTDIPLPEASKYGTVSYKILGTSTSDSAYYKCISVEVPDQCLSLNASEQAPPCEIEHTEYRLGQDSNRTFRGYSSVGGYSRFFRIFPWGADASHYTGKQWLMRGYTSNGAAWYTYTTYSASQSNRNTGFSGGGILGWDKYSSCPSDGGISSNNNPSKNPKIIKLIGRRDFTTVFTIKYPLSKGNEQYSQVY